ncbi:hypothetical protein [Nocardia asteroides]|uniref:hypothetical protein n=1 Tax=Nocardia asteroides TaxID=1824 RepID=UPI001E4B5E65|nr:hypothetical protein [Nocardia asteroides]UGT62136.1 hypothetical protein LTT61_01930 [Nocardia asteroides]
MSARMFCLTLAVGVCCVLPAPVAGAEPASVVIATDDVPARTAFSTRTLRGGGSGSANENEPRAALSLAKLYLVDYAVRHGTHGELDRAAGERAIRFSDDAAADTLDAAYPDAVDAIAAEFGLTHTGGGYWGTSTTSTSDVATFLLAKLRADRDSPILEWMADAAPVAADGTEQNWGTADLPGVLGTKWGWSDTGISEVASASFGVGYVVVANTIGSTGEHTADVFAGFGAAAFEVTNSR